MLKYYIIIILFIGSGCAIRAPEDYYLLFRGMEAWGQKNRANTKRAIGEIVEPPEKQQPLVVAFSVGEKPAGFLGFSPVDTNKSRESIETQNTDSLLEEALPKADIAIQNEAFRQVCRDEGIQLIHWRPQNGRSNGRVNVVQIHFVPQSFSDIAIHREFLLLTAIAYGSQVEENTIDTIRAIAEDDSGSPLMMLEGSIRTYQQYFSGKIGLQNWRSQLQIKKY